MSENTTLSVSAETWRRINSKKDPGDTVDDVVRELLDHYEADAEVEA